MLSILSYFIEIIEVDDNMTLHMLGKVTLLSYIMYYLGRKVKKLTSIEPLLHIVTYIKHLKLLLY